MTQTQQHNVPSLRFPEFSGEWEKLKLGDIGPVLMCKRIMKDETKPSGEIPFFKIGTFGRKPDAFIGRALFDSFREKYPFPSKGDILISAAGTIGRLVVYDGNPAYFQDSNIVWIANDESTVWNAFLLYCYKNVRWTTENTTIPRLYNENLRNIRVSTPPLPEQQKIASFLSSVDSKIEQLGKKKALLEQYKKGMMQKLFSQELRFKDAQGNDFPDWKEKRLGDVAKFTKGKGVSKSEVTDEGATPCIRYGQLYTQYAETISEVISKTNVPVGQLVISERNDVIIPASGETALDIATASCVILDGIALGGDLNIIRSSMNGVFLAYYLNSNKKIEIARLAQGISVVHLYAGQLKTLLLSLPSQEEQQKIADFLSSIDQKIDLVATELDHAKTFKKGLLQQMFI